MNAPMSMPRRATRSSYSLDELLPIIRGEVEIPNLEEQPTDKALATLACCAGLAVIPHVASVKLPGQQHRVWARYFLSTGQGGGYDGTGYVIWYASRPTGDAIGKIGTFAICKHEHVEGPGADHNRGWHPGYCSKCGLDMTVDSSD